MGASAPCGTMSAQGHPHGPNLMATLNLTPAQKAQIKQIHEQFRAAHPCGSTVTPQQRAQLRQQVMSVLTPQQQAQLRAERQQEHGGNPPGSTPQY
jgi:Spy/CpxP family protein refolding chaperone